ncbi:autotransporter-associated beta strand repeat-containing protein, partial [Prosthecobacter sp.]
MTASFTTSTSAATLHWDADGVAAGNAVDGSGLGGTGTWNTTALNWWDLTTDTAWPNTTADTAIFAGQAGQVTLDGTLQAGGLVFESDGHTLTGGTLMLGGAATIDVTTSNRAVISAEIAGVSGLVKSGGGVLSLGRFNSYSGVTTINGGVVEVLREESLGTTGDIVLDGGTLRALGNEFYSLRNITVEAGGGTLDVTRTASNFGTMRLRGQISGAGTLTKTGFGELRLDGDSSGFTGPFVLDSGIVRIKGTFDRGEVASLPALGASSLTVRSGGELILDYSSFSTTPAYSFVNEDLPVHLEGGRLQFLSNNATGTGIWTQKVGDLSLDRGTSRVYLNRSSSGSAAVWSFGNLTRAAGSTISFDWTTSAGTLGAPGLNPRILFESLSEPVNDGIMGGWALVNLNDFATYDAVFGVAIATYTSSDITTAGATDNVEMSQGNTVISIGDTTINALKWSVTASTGVIEQADGSTLTIDTGG